MARLLSFLRLKLKITHISHKLFRIVSLRAKVSVPILFLVFLSIYLLIAHFRPSSPPPPRDLTPPGVLLYLKGGIGNQLFQYACHYALSKHLDWPLYIVPRHKVPSSRQFLAKERFFALDQFQIPLADHLLDEPINPVNLTRLSESEFLAMSVTPPNSSKIPPNELFALHKYAYCQSLEFWADHQDAIRTLLEPRYPPKIRNQTQQNIVSRILKGDEETVAVHIRRGDFLATPNISLSYFVPMSHQRHAIRQITSMLSQRGKENPTFVFFSDDISVVKKYFADITASWNVIFVSGNGFNSVEEFFLMRHCKHIIFSNSTFAWWAAYLIKNKDKIVITSTFNPNYWFMTKNLLFLKFYHPKKWIVLNPFTGHMKLNNSKPF